MVIRTFQYKTQQEYIKCALNGLLSLLLLFTAAIVSNIESVQQTLSLTLEAAYIHVFVPVEVLIWVRSLAIVLLIVAHALRHVHQGIDSSSEQTSKSKHAPQTLDPELLRTALSQTTVSEEERCLQELPAPDGEQEREQGANIAQEASEEDKHDEKVYQDEQEANNFERVKTYLTDFPGSTDREIAHALSISASTANKWRKRVLREND
ncbi:hypothetical protein EPA93_43255 [Ktedonosporobacter rubrisoli]|uniref:Uncharacterized protein n=1 Tax=Ktedonosporobacter rubrisoli TaxID=2509675 RepID=A0A4P6K2R8_KTERU|nr:hypothetical protein [Ktedonosporobacter rubrisoli]QBD82434.1 hypothetical protein EPA93_43255 [Ktedonosporobacter rubrisoli]